MIATTLATFVVLAIGCFVLNYFGWIQVSRHLSAVAWVVIIAGLTFVLGRVV